MYRYDNYTDSFVRVDGEPNTGSTTVRVGVPLKESMIVQKTELTDECINMIADAVVRKLADRKTEPSNSEIPNNYCDDCLYTDTCDSKEFFYACTSKATISKMEQVDKDINVRSKDEPTWEQVKEYCNKRCLDIVDSAMRKQWYKDEPQTDCDNCMYLHCNYECAGEIVHKMIDDAVIAEDVYPDLRQRMHDAVDEYEPRTERSDE